MANNPAVEKSWEAMVRSADPSFDSKNRREIEYEMSNGRKFRADRSKRHPYDTEET